MANPELTNINDKNKILNPAIEDKQSGIVSEINSTGIELAIGEIFTGGWEDTLDFSELIVSVHSEQNSATDGLVIQWSSNGEDVHGTDEFTITANSGKTFSFPCQNRYVRVVYTNNGIIQSHFDLQVILKRYASKGSSHRLKDNINMEDDSIVTKSMIAGFSTAGGGSIVNVKVNPSGSLQVGGNIGITDTNDTQINPATEETISIIAGLVRDEDTPHSSGDKGCVIFGIRSDSDIATAGDGDYTVLKLDEQGRLKVSSKPASYPDITGDITAVQATISTPVAGGTVAGDVSRASNIMIFCTGTFSGVNCTFEGSLQDTGDTNWFGVQAVRSNANTIETTTGTLSAQPVYAWEASVNALKRFRVRCTARTSGTQSWRFVQGTYATEPIPAAQISGTQPISGTVGLSALPLPPAPTTPYFLNSAASTNGALIITGTSGLVNFYATNEGAQPAYVKLYNKATAPVVGTDIPEMTITVPAASGGIPGSITLPIGFVGFRFALGLGIAITRNAIYTDTAAVGASEVKVKLSRTT